MDVLYIPQLDEGDGGGDVSAGRYRLLKRVPEDGTVTLTDRAVTRVEMATADPIRFVVPPLVKGAVRDFFVRLVITSDTIPEVTFAAPTGETLSIEDQHPDVLMCEIGVNIFSFTEVDEGVFIVSRKLIDIWHQVEFDGGGGTVDETRKSYHLGSRYAEFPTVYREGYLFEGWFTAAEDGVRVQANDTVKSGVVKLYARWSVYVDPFVDAICPAKNLTFYTSGNAGWTVDSSTFHSSPGSARSGTIAHASFSTLTARIEGPGTLNFWWKASSEPDYDKLRLLVDGTQVATISGDRDWENCEKVLAAGTHEIEWRYEKDESVSSGSDHGWVDDVTWTPR